MASLNDDKITYRHPHLKAGKYEKNICFGVGKFSDSDQKQIKIDLEKLLESKPYSESDAPKRDDGSVLHSRALQAYFEPMEKAGVKPPRNGSEFHNNFGPYYGKPTSESDKVGLRWRKRAVTAEALAIKLEARIRELEDFVKEMQAVSGARSEAERETTLRSCVEHFEAKFRCKGSQEQRDDIIRRVKKVSEARMIKEVGGKEIVLGIGLDAKYASITLHGIEDAITASAPATEGEAFKRRQAIKRFFKFLSLPTNEGGLAFGSNPAQNMYVGSVGSIQKKNIVRDKGIKVVDPATLLAIDGLSPFHRVAFAVLGYAGLRLSEMAGLLWTDIDFKNRVLKIQPNEVKTNMKTHDSNRLVKPFGNVWSILENWKAQSDPKATFAFNRPSNGKTWFTIYKGQPRCVALSHFLQDELKRKNFEPNKEVARRLRRFWSTKMAELGYGQYESAMGGHSPATAQAVYQERQRLVMSATIGSI